ncbi:metal ABC transporter permease [Marinicrinis sediminis]|uniref:Metal ABC transporter permease n=1 Tax=Marinicrinis sediminis TaxID=1652465 RepID=A0ABW5RB65_9BACL
MEMLQYGFMQRAFWAGGLIALVAPVLGVYLLLRRQVLMADTLSHISLTGVALGALLGFNPVVGAFLVALSGAIGMEKLRRAYRSYSEVSIAIVMTSGLALAVVLMSLNQGLNLSFTAYLFGSIVAVNEMELLMIFIVVVLALLFLFFMRRPLYNMTFDEETADVNGLAVRSISMSFSIVTGMTIAVSMPILGVLLVSAMMVLPASLAVRVAKGFASAIAIAIGVSLVGMFSGLSVSYYVGTPPGGTIALILVLILGGGLTYTRLGKWLKRKQHGFKEESSELKLFIPRKEVERNEG